MQSNFAKMAAILKIYFLYFVQDCRRISLKLFMGHQDIMMIQIRLNSDINIGLDKRNF